MAEQTLKFSKNQIPKEGLEVALSAGNSLTKIHLDMSSEGVVLAMVGAATASLSKGKRQVVKLQPTKEGISLAMVGAATSATRK